MKVINARSRASMAAVASEERCRGDRRRALHRDVRIAIFADIRGSEKCKHPFALEDFSLIPLIKNAQIFFYFPLNCRCFITFYTFLSPRFRKCNGSIANTSPDRQISTLVTS